MHPVPFNETGRLAALKSYAVLDTPPERAFDNLTKLAATQFDVPIALVSLVDEARQWFKSHHGLDASETPRDVAFCGHAILQDQPLIVPDATRDERFAGNDLVCGTPGIRFYAGAPLVTRSGFRLGTFCIIDLKRRAVLTAGEIGTLQTYAETAMELLDLRRAAVGSAQRGETHASSVSAAELQSVVAHEIRSPVATLLSIARTIESRALGPIGNPRYEAYCTQMAETAELMMGIVDRQLESARAGAGDLTMQEAVAPVESLVRQAMQLAQPQAKACDAEITVARLPADATLRADGVHVVQMLTNLLSNALKYSHGTPRVQIAASRTSDGSLSIAVSDQGVGMHSRDVERALQPFCRIAATDRADPGGVGIGLPLVKRLIELHGGRLVIDSDPGYGTTVTLVFPAWRVGVGAAGRAADAPLRA